MEGKARLNSTPSLSFKGAYSGVSAKQLFAAIGTSAEGVEGVITGDFSLSGKPSVPSLTLTASSPAITAAGLSLATLRAKAEGTTTSLKISDFSAKLLDSPMSMSGVVGLSKGEKTDLKLSMQALDLHELAAKFLPEARLGGKLAGELRLTG